MKFNVPEFSVLEFSRSIKRVVEDSFGYVKLSGEITGFKKAASGHLYFSLKEENAIISAVCFKGYANAIDFEVADGLQVRASGRVTTYEGRSNYQIIVENIEIDGIGAILEMIEKRRKKLLTEGIFDEIHKKEIPFIPKIIGVITSKTGAVIEDIKHRIEDRFPTNIKLYPVTVQGEKCANDIIAAIKYFNRVKKEERPKVIIIARGGGSFEDLLPFNDEELVREVFKSEIPIISAIGHETDTSLIDYAADLRAPTPTAAAEFATPIYDDLLNQLDNLSNKLQILPINYLQTSKKNIDNLEKYIVDPQKMLEQISQRFHNLEQKFVIFSNSFFEEKQNKINSLQISNQAVEGQINLIDQKTNHLFQSIKSYFDNKIKEDTIKVGNLEKLLKSNHYNEILKRGFALVKNESGLVSSKDKLKANDNILIELIDGEVEAKIK